MRTSLKRFLEEHNYDANYVDLFFTLYSDIQDDESIPLVDKTDILQRLHDVSELLLPYSHGGVYHHV